MPNSVHISVDFLCHHLLMKNYDMPLMIVIVFIIEICNSLPPVSLSVFINSVCLPIICVQLLYDHWKAAAIILWHLFELYSIGYWVDFSIHTNVNVSVFYFAAQKCCNSDDHSHHHRRQIIIFSSFLLFRHLFLIIMLLN